LSAGQRRKPAGSASGGRRVRGGRRARGGQRGGIGGMGKLGRAGQEVPLIGAYFSARVHPGHGQASRRLHELAAARGRDAGQGDCAAQQQPSRTQGASGI
jgi:hypothetical protein